MNNSPTADFAAWLRWLEFFSVNIHLQYASLKKFCAALPVAKLDGRPALFVNDAGKGDNILLCLALDYRKVEVCQLLILLPLPKNLFYA